MPLYVKFNPEKLYRSNMSKRERVKRIADECTEKPAVATNALIVYASRSRPQIEVTEALTIFIATALVPATRTTTTTS